MFNPARFETESFAAYQMRRHDGNIAAKRMTLVGKFKPTGQCSRQAMRDAQRESGAMKKVAGAYGRGLRNWITRTQAAKAA